MRTSLHNSATQPRTGWVPVTFPVSATEVFGDDCSFQLDDSPATVWDVVKGEALGTARRVFYVHATLDAGETVTGRLINEPARDKSGEFQLHPWFADNISDNVVNLHILTGGQFKTASISNLHLVHQNRAVSRWGYRVGIPGTELWADHFLDFFSGDPVARFWGVASFSGPSDQVLSEFRAIGLSCGEQLSLNLSGKEGYSAPTEVVGKSYIVTDIYKTLRNGEGRLYSGRVIAQPEGLPESFDPEGFSDDIQVQFSSARAGLESSMSGLYMGWGRGNSPFLASIVTPGSSFRTVHSRVMSDVAHDLRRFVSEASTFGDPFLGVGKNPGGTGDQDDFGAVQGTHLVDYSMHEMLEAYRHAAYTDAKRGYLKREADGAPISLEDHPALTFWSGEVHWHHGVSPDRLGKPREVLGGWRPYDRQHRSQNTALAYLMVEDDPAYQMLLETGVKTSDFGDVRHKFNQISAARGEGRTIGTFAHLSTFFPEYKELIRSIARNQRNHSRMQPGKNLRVLNKHNPDGRKRIYNTTGELIDTVSMWEHGLAVIGWQLAINVMPDDEDVRWCFDVIVDTLATWGCFAQGDKWYIVDDVAYLDGDGPPVLTSVVPEDGTPRWSVAHGPGASGGTWLWTLFGLETCLFNLPEGNLRNKVEQCLRARLPSQPQNRRDLGWRANVGRVR